MYDPAMVQPMRDEVTRAGFIEAPTAAAVDGIFSEKPKSALFFINSVCGCAAGTARPGAIAAAAAAVKPEKLVTAFAGNDKEGVDRMRELFVGYPPSSPCFALFRENKLVYMIERHQIEGQSAETIGKILTSAFSKFCGEEVDEKAKIYDPLADLILSAETAKALYDSDEKPAFLDVREDYEIAEGAVEGAQKVTNELASEILSTWPKDRQIVVYCQHGVRSLQAVQYLRGQGFDNAWSLEGGYAAWAAL